jgi:hypothetical protein
MAGAVITTPAGTNPWAVIGSPAMCCCQSPPCDVMPFVYFTARMDCCGTNFSEDLHLTITRDGETIWDETYTDGNYVVLDLPDLAIGETLEWTVECPPLPTKTGTITVPGCGQSIGIQPIWTLPEVFGDTLYATVLGTEAVLGAESQTVDLTYDTSPVVTPAGTYYTWSKCFYSGAYGMQTINMTIACMHYNSVGNCVDFRPYGYPVFPRAQITGYVQKKFYGSTRVGVTVFVPYGNTDTCKISFGWINFWEPYCADGPDGTNIPLWKCSDLVCECGIKAWPNPSDPLPTPPPGAFLMPNNTMYTKTFPDGWTMTPTELTESCEDPDWTGAAGTYVPGGCNPGATVHITK